jgi:hypothetical protein
MAITCVNGGAIVTEVAGNATHVFPHGVIMWELADAAARTRAHCAAISRARPRSSTLAGLVSVEALVDALFQRLAFRRPQKCLGVLLESLLQDG